MTTQRTLHRRLLGASLTAAVFTLPLAGFAQPADVTQPGDLIQLVNGVNDGDGNSGPPPAGEIVDHAIDNVGQKYLNFLDLGSGFIVQPSAGPTVVNTLRFYPANDAVERDPASYVFEGSLSAAAATWTTISSGNLSLPATRNNGGNTALAGLVYQDVTFANSTPFGAYRVTFPTLKDAAAANSMQIAEVELIGVVIPEPSTFALLGLASLGWMVRRRRA